MVQEVVDMLKNYYALIVSKGLYLEAFKITCKTVLNRLPQMKRE